MKNPLDKILKRNKQRIIDDRGRKLSEALGKKIEEKKKKEQKTPTEVTEPFLKAGFFEKTFKRREYKKELKEPLLFLMTTTGDIKVFENMEPGVFRIGSEDNQKGIHLTANKMQRLLYNGERYKCWVAYEEEMSPYPHDVIHDSGLFLKLIQKISLNYRELDQKQFVAKGKMWLMILAGVAIVIYFLWNSGMISSLLAKEPVQQATQAAVETVKQNLTVATNVVRAG